MALYFVRTARQLVLAVAFILVGALPLASQAQSGATPVRNASEQRSQENLAVAAAASPALELPQLADAAQQGTAAERRSANPPPGQSGTVRTITSMAAGLLVLVLVIAGIALTIHGLRDDLRKRKRSYRRRSRRIAARNQA